MGAWIAEQLTLKGGGQPSERAVQQAVARCKEADWYPGKDHAKSTGRPVIYTDSVKNDLAGVAMSLKRQLIRPTPQEVRAKRPRRCLNPETGQPASNDTIYRIFKTRCYDESEDDPSVYLPTLSKDYLPSGMRPRRCTMAQHTTDAFSACSWSHSLAFDPCSSLLPKTLARSEEQKIAAMGQSRFMSRKSRGKHNNLRAPATAKSQSGGDVLQIYWTPILAKGKVRIYLCDPEAAKRDQTLPAKLNESAELSKFIRNVLPGELKRMQQEHGWSSLPRTVIHDKASYMVNHKAEVLNANFDAALTDAGLKSWADGGTRWMAPRFGDVYPHETCISHIRRLLDHKFVRTDPKESFIQFRNRMAKVEAYLNSDDCAAREDGGLWALCQEMKDRCKAVLARKGDRLPK